ncbi:hydroxylysine kinase-like isoform X2 [Haliotis rubra]|uniref:hydroxylysine kinase-like isoform X2 n=1 Tax=Haliotis rubra TaxID=36100 RepID=UPI001EE50431|nr:hydroxylysine kinase-like isoform X2 [Haliotis rubra]
MSASRRPVVTEGKVRDILQTHYSLDTKCLRQLDSFVDRNYKVTTTDGREYVFKIVNPDESENDKRVQAQLGVVNYLRGCGFICPVTVANRDGLHTWKSTFPIGKADGPDETCVVRLMTFVPGEPLGLCQQLFCGDMYKCLGVLLGQLHAALQDYPETDLTVESHSEWMGENAGLLSQFMPYPEEETLSEDIRAVIKNVESSLKERGHAMERGVIHGDFQDYNIILHPATVDFKTSVASLDSKTIFGIIDFNDICYTYRVFEVGRLIADAMTNCNCSDQEALQIGGRILSGYLSIRPLNIEDMTMLYHAVCITFCQYYVLGQHAVSQQTDNPYCSLGFAEAGRWLERVLALSSRTLWEIWTPVLSEAGISL